MSNFLFLSVIISSFFVIKLSTSGHNLFLLRVVGCNATASALEALSSDGLNAQTETQILIRTTVNRHLHRYLRCFELMVLPQVGLNIWSLISKHPSGETLM
jgi:hypothetical protein